MWAIALDYGISLADLQAANPDVDPRAMPVGTVLIIPGQ
jgi:LysM repeat protein